MKTGLTKKQKVTEVYYNAKDPTAEVYTHDTKLKKRLLEYAAKFPELCQQTDDDEHGGLRFEIDKSRISIRLTAPYSKERITKLRTTAKSENLIYTMPPSGMGGGIAGIFCQILERQALTLPVPSSN